MGGRRVQQPWSLQYTLESHTAVSQKPRCLYAALKWHWGTASHDLLLNNPPVFFQGLQWRMFWLHKNRWIQERKVNYKSPDKVSWNSLRVLLKTGEIQHLGVHRHLRVKQSEVASEKTRHPTVTTGACERGGVEDGQDEGRHQRRKRQKRINKQTETRACMDGVITPSPKQWHRPDRGHCSGEWLTAYRVHWWRRLAGSSCVRARVCLCVSVCDRSERHTLYWSARCLCLACWYPVEIQRKVLSGDSFQLRSFKFVLARDLFCFLWLFLCNISKLVDYYRNHLGPVKEPFPVECMLLNKLRTAVPSGCPDLHPKERTGWRTGSICIRGCTMSSK